MVVLRADFCAMFLARLTLLTRMRFSAVLLLATPFHLLGENHLHNYITPKTEVQEDKLNLIVALDGELNQPCWLG